MRKYLVSEMANTRGAICRSLLLRAGRSNSSWFGTSGLLLFIILNSPAARAASQVMTLQPGWNLITFQVLPTNTSPQSVFSALLSESSGKPLYNSGSPAQSQLRAAYDLMSVDASAGIAKFIWRSFEPGGDVRVDQLPRLAEGHANVAGTEVFSKVEFGRSYYVYVAAVLADARYIIEGDPAPGSTGITIQPSWNLIGFPLPLGATGEAVSHTAIGSVFRPGDLTSISRILRWDARSQRFSTYKIGDSEFSEFQTLDAQAGYWIEATKNFGMSPDLVIQASADADLPPLADPPVAVGQPWVPGPEDTDFGLPGGSPVFDDSSTQRVLRIRQDRTSLTLPFYNRGGGVLGWKAELQPYTSPLALPAVALGTPEQVGLVLSLRQAQGLALSSTENLEIEVDRTHLPSGTYVARLKVSASTGQERSFDIVIDATGLAGQWMGIASIETVNGRQNSVADVDLYLQLTEDTLSGSRQVRGIVDSRETLLWPRDAHLMGHSLDYSVAGGASPGFAHRFVLEGGVTIEPGDLNRFPFDTFPLSSTTPGDDIRTEVDRATGLSYRTNRDGDRHYFTLPGREKRADFTNPLPSFISRDIQLLGQLAGTEKGNPVLVGEYREVVRGLMPQPVKLTGKFRLVRRGPTPYRADTYFYETPAGGVSRAANTPLSAAISVPNDLLIDRVLVVVSQEAPDRRHSLRLTAPDGTEIVLHNAEGVGPAGGVIFDSGKTAIDPLSALNPPELRGATPLPAATPGGLNERRYEHLLRESLAAYVVRAPRQSLEGLIGKSSHGTWTLRWEHSEAGKTNRFNGWSLLVYGTPIYQVSGQVVIEGDESAGRFDDVSLDVVGLNANVAARYSIPDKTTGKFSIPTIPGLRIDVLATKPGYAQGHIDKLDTADHPRGFVDHLDGFLAGGPGSSELTITVRPENILPRVSVSPLVVRSSAVTGIVRVPLKLTLSGSIPAGVDLKWDPLWDGVTAQPSATPVTTRKRALTLELTLPVARFTTPSCQPGPPAWCTSSTVALKPRVQVGSSPEWIALDDWVIVTLDSSEPNQKRIVQIVPLSGFGAEVPFNGADPTGAVALQAQKTSSAKVDVDRPPYIDPSTNPSLSLDDDGLPGEDLDLHPRSFVIHPSAGDSYAYAEILATPDTRYTKLAPPLPGQVPAYNDIEQRIDGRDINAPGEPVQVFSAIGGQIGNLGSAGTDGRIRIRAGSAPGPTGRSQHQ